MIEAAEEYKRINKEYIEAGKRLEALNKGYATDTRMNGGVGKNYYESAIAKLEKEQMDRYNKMKSLGGK